MALRPPQHCTPKWARVLSGLAFVFALVMWGINKFGDQQGGLAEKSMMGGISAGVAFAAAAVMVQGIDMNYQAG